MQAVLHPKCLAEFIKLIHELTGVTIAENRNSMVEGRLRKRMIKLGVESYEVYLQIVRESKEEQIEFIDIVTTHETYFYRTPRIWNHIETSLLPRWFAGRANATFRAWSAAASSGEEAYTLGVVCQAFKENNPSFQYQILGTDVSSEMVRRSQQGHFSGRSIEAFRKARSELFALYLEKVDGETYTLQKEIKKQIQFRCHNLFSPLPLNEQFDLILIRNVLIYFKGPDQEKVISLLAPKLSSDGTLIIGESESLNHISTNFQSCEPLVYKKKLDHSLHKAS